MLGRPPYTKPNCDLPSPQLQKPFSLNKSGNPVGYRAIDLKLQGNSGLLEASPGIEPGYKDLQSSA